MAWYYNHVIWTDICNSVLPRSEKKASEQALARKGKKGWGSAGCELHSLNLRGNKESLKQNSWDAIRVYWLLVLIRGKLHVEVFDADFPGEVPAGATVLVDKVRAAVNIRFQGQPSKPDTIFTDRGKGFYDAGHGKITQAQSCRHAHATAYNVRETTSPERTRDNDDSSWTRLCRNRNRLCLLSHLQ